MDTRRIALLLAGVWAGAILTIGGVAAPSAFAVAIPEIAGKIAGRMLAIEAHASLAFAVLIFLLMRRRARDEASATGSSVFSAEMVLALVALFLTVLGYFALQPVMQAARAGQGPLSFGAAHGVSLVFFGLKGLVVLGLFWRLARR